MQGQELDSVILGIILCGSYQLRIFCGLWLLSLCLPGGAKSSAGKPDCAQNKEIPVQGRGRDRSPQPSWEMRISPWSLNSQN